MKHFRKTILFLICAMLLSVQPLSLKAEANGAYHVYVNVRTNTVTVYDGDVPVRVMPCSTGGGTPRGGTYTISNKYRWRNLFYGVHGQYATRITGSILFHSVPYMRYGNPGSLEPGQFDLLGTAASAGCVRLMVRDAKWIQENLVSGRSKVTFYADDNPGPLGAAPLYRIGGAPAEFQGWDPSDPDGSNPWNRDDLYLGLAFDAETYARENPDLAAVYGWDELGYRIHWICSGIPEGRCASDWFDLAYYKEHNPDLAAYFGDDNYAYVRHFITSGFWEGRPGCARVAKDIAERDQKPQETDPADADGPADSTDPDAVRIHRLYLPATKEHLYTGNTYEALQLSRAGWKYEGAGWEAPVEGTPVYRLFNPFSGEHHYTMDAQEHQILSGSGWNDEGICWYSGGTVPVYRAFHPKLQTGTHLYTTDYAEISAIAEGGWIYEGIAWYGK